MLMSRACNHLFLIAIAVGLLHPLSGFTQPGPGTSAEPSVEPAVETSEDPVVEAPREIIELPATADGGPALVYRIPVSDAISKPNFFNPLIFRNITV